MWQYVTDVKTEEWDTWIWVRSQESRTTYGRSVQDDAVLMAKLCSVKHIVTQAWLLDAVEVFIEV